MRTHLGTNGILITGTFVYLMVFSYLLYPVAIGPLGWSEQQTITELGGSPEILIDDSEGAFVFWIGKVLTPNRTIEGAQLVDSGVGDTRVLFQGYEDLPIYDITVVGDNSGYGYIHVSGQNWWFDNVLIIIDLAELAVARTVNPRTELGFDIEEIYPGAGRILAKTDDNQVVSIYQNGSYNVEAELHDRNINNIIESQNGQLFIFSYNSTSNHYSDTICYLDKFDAQGILLQHVLLDEIIFPEDIFIFDSGQLLLLNIVRGTFSNSHYEYSLLDENFKVIKTAELENTDFYGSLYWDFSDAATLFKGRISDDQLTFTFVSNGKEIYVNKYDKDMNLLLSRKYPVELPDDIVTSLGIHDNGDLEIVYLDSTMYNIEYSYNDFFAGELIYFSKIEDNFQPLILYLIGLGALYLIILYFSRSIYKKNLKRREKLIEKILAEDDGEKHKIPEEALKTIQTKFKKAKERNDRGRLLFGKENPVLFRKRLGFTIITITIIISISLLLVILYPFYFFNTIFLVMVLIFALIIGLETGLILLFVENPTPRIFEFGLDFPGAPIPYFKKPRFYWFADLIGLQIRVEKFQAIRHPFLDLAKRNEIVKPRGLMVVNKEQIKFIYSFAILKFRNPDAPKTDSKINNEYLVRDIFLKLFPGLSDALGNQLYNILNFEPVQAWKSDIKFWKKCQRRSNYYSSSAVGVILLISAILLMSYLYILFPNLLYLVEWMHADNNYVLLQIIFFTLLLILTSSIILILKYYSVKKLLTLQANGVTIPSKIKQTLLGYKKTARIMDLSSPHGMNEYLNNIKTAKKGYRIPKALYFSSIFIIILLVFPKILFYDDSDDTIIFKNPYTTNLYDFPGSNQYFLIEDTTFQDEIIYLEDNITISRGATVTMENTTILIFQHGNSHSSLSDIKIFISQSSTLIMKNCYLKLGEYIHDFEIEVQGSLSIQDSKLEHLNSVINVHNGYLEVKNSYFNNCDNCIDLFDSSFSLESTEFKFCDDPIEITDSEGQIKNCDFNAGYSYSDYYRPNGILIEKQDYWAEGIEILLENNQLSGFKKGIKVEERNPDLPLDLTFVNNEIKNCSTGLLLALPPSKLLNNYFYNCSIAIIVDFEISTKSLLEPNHFSKNEVILEKYYDLLINCLNFLLVRQNAFFEAIDNYGMVEVFYPDYYYSKYDGDEFKYPQEKARILKTRIYQNGSLYDPFPYSIYAFTELEGCGVTKLDAPQNEINITVGDFYDVRVESLFLNTEYDVPYYQLLYKCLGNNVSQVNVSVLINDKTVENWTVGSCKHKKAYSLKYYLENITFPTFDGNLEFKLESDDDSRDILPENNFAKANILYINDDHTIDHDLLDHELVYLKSGETTINDQQIVLVNENEEETFHWIISENAALKIRNSSIELFDKYSELYSNRLTFQCNGDFELYDSTLTRIPFMQFQNSYVIITNSSIYDSSIHMMNCDFLFSNSSLNNTGIWGREFYSYHSDMIIDGCKIRRMMMSFYREEKYQNLNMQNDQVQINNSQIEGSYLGISYSNLSFNSVELLNTYLEISYAKVTINDSLMTGVQVFCSDSYWNFTIMNSKISENSLIYLWWLKNSTIINTTFSDCEVAFYIENSTPIFENLTFYNNTYDLYLVGHEAIDWLANISNVTALINYDVTLNLTDPFGGPLEVTNNLDYYLINITNKNGEVVLEKNVSFYYEEWVEPKIIRLKVYEKDKSGKLKYFDNYKIRIEFYNKFHEMVKQEIFELSPSELVPGQEIQIKIDI